MKEFLIMPFRDIAGKKKRLYTLSMAEIYQKSTTLMAKSDGRRV
jgi:hypothetical protein